MPCLLTASIRYRKMGLHPLDLIFLAREVIDEDSDLYKHGDCP